MTKSIINFRSRSAEIFDLITLNSKYLAIRTTVRMLRFTTRAQIHSTLSSRLFSSTATARGPLLSAIKHDHQELRAYEPHIITNENSDERIRYRNIFVWELARYLIGEEIVVYPAMEKHLNDGRDVASKDCNQHQTVRRPLLIHTVLTHQFSSRNNYTSSKV